jgi:hypothetical protein
MPVSHRLRVPSANIGTTCTWSCSNPADYDGQKCPNDSTGVIGVCVSSINGDDFANRGYGFCFQDCSSGNPCPMGETCQQAQALLDDTPQSMVCIPSSGDF